MLAPDEADQDCALRLRRLRETFGDRGYVALALRRRPNDQLRLFELSNLAASMRVPTIVTNDVLFHEPAPTHPSGCRDMHPPQRHYRRAGDRRERHADRHLKSPEEMHRLFARYPEALARTGEIVHRCRFSLDELAYQYPEERADPSLTPQQTLEKSDLGGRRLAVSRGPCPTTWSRPSATNSISSRSCATRRISRPSMRSCALRGPRTFFARVAAAPRIALSATSWASPRSIPLETTCRSSASSPRSATSRLTSTSISNMNGAKIVMQWIFDQYGRDHAALCSTVIRYRTKGAIRDVGNALGLTEDLIKMLSSQVWGWSEDGVEDEARRGAELQPF